MASPRRNLPAFTEIAERVALLESIRSSPSAVPAHYANVLRPPPFLRIMPTFWRILQWYSGSGLASRLLLQPILKLPLWWSRFAGLSRQWLHRRDILCLAQSATSSALHLALARINPSFHLSATSSPVVTYKDTHPTGPVCFIFLLFSLFPNLIFLQRVPRGHIAGKGKRIDPLETASAPAGTSEDTDIEVCTYEFFKVSSFADCERNARLGIFSDAFGSRVDHSRVRYRSRCTFFIFRGPWPVPRSVASRLRVAFLPA